MKNTKMKVITLILSTVMILSAVSFVSCSKIKNAALSFQNALDYSALGGIGLLNSGVSAPMTASVKSNPQFEFSLSSSSLSFGTFKLISDEKEVLTDELKADILKNLAIAETTLKNDVKKSKVTASDKEGYTSMYTLTATDSTGEKKVYTFYYNDTTEKDEPDKDDKEKDEPKEEDNETESSFKGIIVCDGKEFSMTGETEISKDEEEYKFKINKDENNYVVIEQEKEKGETEFSYTYVQDGKEILETEVEYEVQKDGSTKMSFENESPEGETEYSYTYTTVDGKPHIKVEIEKGKTEYDALIEIKTDEKGNKIYEFVK